MKVIRLESRLASWIVDAIQIGLRATEYLGAIALRFEPENDAKYVGRSTRTEHG